LREMLGTCCDVYNSFLHWRRYNFDLFGTSPSYYEQKKALPIWKKDHPELGEVHSQVLQDVCRRADLAYQSYFDRLADYQERKAKGCLKEGEKCPGPPRSKGKGVYDSITYTQAASFEVGENALSVSKLGCFKAVIHRALPGIPKTCTIRRQSGKWFATISCEVEAELLPESQEQVGIDVGLNHFAITSDEEFIDNLRFFRQDEKALAKAQRKFARVGLRTSMIDYNGQFCMSSARLSQDRQSGGSRPCRAGLGHRAGGVAGPRQVSLRDAGHDGDGGRGARPAGGR
jgi:putative transposase